MKLETGQVWSNVSGNIYTIVRMEKNTVIYTFKGNYGEYRHEREVHESLFMQSINEHVGYFLLTDLTKALI